MIVKTKVPAQVPISGLLGGVAIQSGSNILLTIGADPSLVPPAGMSKAAVRIDNGQLFWFAGTDQVTPIPEATFTY